MTFPVKSNARRERVGIRTQELASSLKLANPGIKTKNFTNSKNSVRG